jgi:inhibitor of KinA sporulation pathway (predicted exonuclease)
MAMDWSKVLVIDLECTCEENQARDYGDTRQEVIEIGTVLVNTKTLEIEKEEAILVEPFTEITPFCTKLTTLTLEQIRAANAPRFKEACVHLERAWLSRERSWVSWGDFDRRQLERQCRREKAPYPMNATHTNLRAMFAYTFGLSERKGMAEALKFLGLPLDGTHHRGIDDARNIARIFIEMLRAGRKR